MTGTHDERVRSDAAIEDGPLAVPRPDGFGSLDEWCDHMAAEGFWVPWQTRFALGRLVVHAGLTVQEAYDHLESVGWLTEMASAVFIDRRAMVLPLDEVLSAPACP